MIIGFDIDGVLADFITPFLQMLGQRAACGVIDPATVTDPNFMRHPFLTEALIMECVDSVSQIRSSGALWRRCRRRSNGKP